MLKVLVSRKLEKGFSALDAPPNEGSDSCSYVPMSQWLVPVAMKYGSAPFLGDAQILLTESRERPTPLSHSFEFTKQLGKERQAQSQTGVRYQCP